MSDASASDLPADRRGAIVAAALVGIFMQGMNVSVPNAALTHIQGSLSMADDEVGWLFTSYIAASAIAIPLSPWFAACFGRRRVLQISTGIFALGAVLDTFATTPVQLVLARIVQGLGGGTLAPLSIAILVNAAPPARRGRVGLLLLACLLFGISSGPSIGGWLSEYHGWPSIFYVSLAPAAFVFLTMTLCLPERKAEQRPYFDFFGFATLSLGVTALQMVLDRGERLEWFDSPEIWAEAAASVAGFFMFFAHVLTMKTHFFHKTLLRDRSFLFSTVIYFAVGFVLLPTLALTSPMLEELLNYPVDTTGYLTLPRGVVFVGTLIVMVFVPPRIDNRLLLFSGLVIVAYANWRMIHYSPDMDWEAVATAGALQGLGLGTAIPALAKTALATLDQKLHQEAGAIFNLARLYGGTIGIALVQLFFYGNTQAMHLALAKGLTPFRAAAHLAVPLAKPGLAALNEMITGQAAVVAVIGQFKILLFAVLVVCPLVLFLPKPHPAVQRLEPAK